MRFTFGRCVKDVPDFAIAVGEPGEGDPRPPRRLRVGVLALHREVIAGPWGGTGPGAARLHSRG